MPTLIEAGIGPTFSFEDDLAEIDRALESGEITQEEAKALLDRLSEATTEAEAEEILIEDYLQNYTEAT